MAELDMNFSLPPQVSELAQRVKAFVRDKVVPFEKDKRWTAHGPTDDLRRELNALARQAGVFAPHAPEEYGGQHLSHIGRAAVFTAAGYSMLGPVALHCAAPDEGNIHLLDVVARADQRERYLQPLATGAVRSCFCMTEPAPGAGSDPAQLRTTARRDGSDWVINGEKWLITGAEGAAFAIIMAKAHGDETEGAATMFLADMSDPAIRIERTLDTIDSSFVGGHAVVRFDELRVPADAVLGEVGQGFRYAQVRLAPARLTHCMRWLGSAIRAQEIATEFARRRTAFGKPIGEHEGVSFMLADNAIDIHLAQLTIWHTAWVLDNGNRASSESSMAKVICSEAIARVADRSLQILGGLGTTRDTVVERFYRDVRAFRIYDGPSEVHRWAIGRRILTQDAN
ncbi:acyl-CoA dehydrogenase family protein [Bradyrhizobium sp. INPA03-11B]|uniref:acyl-CoA dehydrogenase family protein n=1 Tax=Bradyrhizobium sp. INPA03-11B TaxID=418598 RepID=UPI00338D9211